MKDNSVMTSASPGYRAAAYWFADGFPDLVFGLDLLLFGTIGSLLMRFVAKPWNKSAIVVLLTGFVLYFWKGRALVEELKSRVTYPRTGYAQPPVETTERECNTLTILTLKPQTPANDNVTYYRGGTTMVFYLLFNSWSVDPINPWLALTKMVALGAAFYLVSRNSTRPYPWWSTAILALSGIIFFAMEIPGYLMTLLPILITGVWVTSQGLYRLFNYLRANPLPSTHEGVRA